jgi:hypothetical protein
MSTDIRICPICRRHLFIDQVVCTDCLQPEDHEE